MVKQEKTPPCEILGLDEAEYHARPELSKSQLSDFMDCPLSFWDNHINPDKPKRNPSSAMEIGTAVHCALLEPKLFEAGYVRGEKLDMRKKADKEKQAKLEEDNPGKIILDPTDWEKVLGCVDSLKATPIAKNYLDEVRLTEVTLLYKYFDIPMRSRLDAICFEDVVLDIKTARDASPRGFLKAIRDYKYDIQAVLYSEAYRQVYRVKPKAFIFLVVEPTRPYNVGVYTLTSDLRQRAEANLEAALTKYIACLESQSWPSYADTELVELG